MAHDRLRAEAPAKVNLALKVRSLDGQGRHPLVSLVQTIDRFDALTGERSDNDALLCAGADLPVGADNLVWKAVEALRMRSGDRRPLAFELTKRIPVAAGLAGGSADAAAALVLCSRLLGTSPEDPGTVASRIGADVPFSLHGGFAWLRGHGEQITPIESVPGDYVLAVVVPPFELATPVVYRAWDRLGGPDGPPAGGRDLPPSLREFSPLANDLYPAALSLRPELGDWRAELSSLWDRPVLLSGSGPSLFGFFSDRDEADEAARAASPAARGRFSAGPIGHGARVVGL